MFENRIKAYCLKLAAFAFLYQCFTQFVFKGYTLKQRGIKDKNMKQFNVMNHVREVFFPLLHIHVSRCVKNANIYIFGLKFQLYDPLNVTLPKNT